MGTIISSVPCFAINLKFKRVNLPAPLSLNSAATLTQPSEIQPNDIISFHLSLSQWCLKAVEEGGIRERSVKFW